MRQYDTRIQCMRSNLAFRSALSLRRTTVAPIADVAPPSPHSPVVKVHMFATRVSSFAVGFSAASAAGFYIIKQDIQKNHEALAKECSSLVERVKALEHASKA